MNWLAILRKLAPVLIGIAIGAGVNGWRLSSEYNAERAKAEKAAKVELQKAQEKANQKAKELAKLDDKYTQELSNAKAEADRLADELAAGRRGLRLNAECVHQSETGTGQPDAATPRLNDAAQRDYIRLRERIGTVLTQVRGLQEYIRTQCVSD